MIDPTNPYIATFIRTGTLFGTDTYTVTVTTGVTAVGGATLSSNYTNTLNVTAPTTPVLSVPSFSRGAGQTVNVPNSGTGIPVSLTNASAVTQASFALTYDPTLLTIAASGAVTASAAASAVGLNSISYSIKSVDANHSVLSVSLSGGSGLTAGSTPVPLVNIAASVPASAPYFNKAVLNLGNILVNSTGATGVSAVDEAAYFGDVNGDQQLTALDASLVSQVAVGLGSGFSPYADLDPIIIGGASAGGSLTALDSSLIAQKAVGLTVSEIPDVPGGGASQSGADPKLYFPNFQAVPGQTITVQLRLTNTDADPIQIAALDEAIRFDPNVLTVSNVRTGSLLRGFTTMAKIDNLNGVLRVAQFAVNPLNDLVPGTDGDVLLFDATINPHAKPGTTRLNLARSITSNGSTTNTDVSDQRGELTLSPAPTNRSGDVVDGKVAVLPASASSITLGWWLPPDGADDTLGPSHWGHRN